MIALVRSVILARTSSGSICHVSAQESTKTGVAPAYLIAFTDAMYVSVGTMTSSPGPIPRATSAKCKATVPFETAVAHPTPTYLANRFSNSLTNRPLDDIHPESRHSSTYLRSLPFNSGSYTGIIGSPVSLVRFCSSIAIGASLDVTFSDVLSVLDLDDLQRDFARVAQTVQGRLGHEGALALVDKERLLANGHLGRAMNDDPVFGPMNVTLQAEHRSDVHDDALDLEPAALLQDPVGAPRTDGGRVLVDLSPASGFECVKECLHMLAASSLGDENGIICLNDAQVLDADGRDQPLA